jgi:hypothetical protein
VPLVGCGQTTQTVGQTQAATTSPGPQSSASAEAGRSSGGSGSNGGVSSASAGQTGTNVPTPTGAGGSPGTGGAPSAQTPMPGCAGSVPATHRQLDLYLMVDTNISLPLSTAWDNVRQGLAAYVDHPCAAGVGVGVRYFGMDCSPASYATPTTPTAPLPQNANAIKQQIPTAPLSASPTLPALQGSLMYSGSRANEYPDSEQAVVLLSDGFYDFVCQGPSLIQSIFTPTSIANPSVPIYVVALDTPTLASAPGFAALLNPATRFAPLDAIAQSGKTGQSRHIDLQAGSAEFAKTMVAIQHDAQPCDYAVPDAVRLDPSAMALALQSSTPVVPLPLLPTASACGAGYYFSSRGSQTWATLCPTTCDDVKTRCVAIAWVTGCK